MSQTNILLEAGTNELEIVEFYIDEPAPSSFTGDAPEASGVYRGYYGVNVAKVLEIIRLPKVTGMPEVSHPSVLGAFNLRNHIIPLVDLSVWLDKIRQEKPAECVLTTECNAEPFLRWFDGYLTWHWQYDGQVPAFPAIYGGAIQMFGRAYRGGPTQDLALRMKAGQQLVYGEQIGWLDPRVIERADSGSFLRQIVQLRWQLRRYFFAGQMCRPPQLDRALPTVRADWQWQDNWWVTTDAVLTGTWQLPHAQRAVAMFVNVSDEPLEAVWSCDAATFGFDTPRVAVTAVTPEGPGEQTHEPSQFCKTLIFPPRSAMAWEITQVADR